MDCDSQVNIKKCRMITVWKQTAFSEKAYEGQNSERIETIMEQLGLKYLMVNHDSLTRSQKDERMNSTI